MILNLFKRDKIEYIYPANLLSGEVEPLECHDDALKCDTDIPKKEIRTNARINRKARLTVMLDWDCKTRYKYHKMSFIQKKIWEFMNV